MRSDARTVVPAAAVVLVLAAVAAVAAHVPAHPHAVTPTPTDTPTDVSSVVTTVRAVAPRTGTAWWAVLLGVAAVVLVLGPMIWLVLRHGLGRRHDRLPTDPPDAGDLVAPDARLPEADAALSEAADRLAGGGDPREVVVACWVRLEAAAAAAGRGRRPAETATDVARRWLGADGTTADRAAVDELAALFHEARYSRHPVTDDHRERARAALTTLLRTPA